MEKFEFERLLDNMLAENLKCKDIKVTILSNTWVSDLNFSYVHGKEITVKGKPTIAPYYGRVVDVVIYPTFDVRHMLFLKLVLSGRVCRNFACIIHNRDLVDKPLFENRYITPDIMDYSKIPRLTCNDMSDLSDNAPIDDTCKKYKKLHVHVVCYMQDNAYTNVAFAKKYFLDSSNVRVFGKLKPRLAYLVHGFNCDKATYSISEMCATNYMLQKTDDSLVLELYSDYDLYKIMIMQLENLIDSGARLDSNKCISMIYESNLLPYFKQNRGICFRIFDEYIKKCESLKRYECDYESEILALNNKIVQLQTLLESAGVDSSGELQVDYDIFDLQKENEILKNKIKDYEMRLKE